MPKRSDSTYPQIFCSKLENAQTLNIAKHLLWAIWGIQPGELNGSPQ
jgi:hypothetical protein